MMIDLVLVIKVAAVMETSLFLGKTKRQLEDFRWQDFRNETLKRLFYKMNSNVGSAVLPEHKLGSYLNLLVNLKKRYSNAVVCRYNDDTDCTVTLSDISNIMATSRDQAELLYYWKIWRNATGAPVLEEMHQLFEINNEIANLLNFSNAADMWISQYESNTFESDIMNLWSDIKPLYTQLHAYVRRKLRKIYGGKTITEDGTIPAHLLGNMWGQKWLVYKLTAPYPLNNYPNVTDRLLKKNFTVKCMAQVAEEFFQNLNQVSLSSRFWEKSILEKPEDREISCQASAWDLFTGKDYRLKMCLTVNAANFLSLHHEMAHIHYFMEYRQQPTLFHEELNPGFSEAVGDAVVLAAGTNRHLQSIGLLTRHVEVREAMINYLFNIALNKITELPYALIMDLHRWNIFRNAYNLDNYNCEWWKLREKFQGISSPVKRSNLDFDPASKHHVIANKPYISYFVSIIQQFQLYKTLCIKANQYDPQDPMDPHKLLHNCDFSSSIYAGKYLKELLGYGSSQPWHRIMKIFTGDKKLSAKPLLEFFRPLQDYLEQENRRAGEFIGWHESRNLCRHSSMHKRK
ncbi:angiotensin-converting enzyme isoform X2 [Cephus cinctus]|uniref:Angiotensin-converting enzyme n=1 Tax=Cephus cinctus TaxID=211228 RepID=A0AAJ7W1N6_CEPCN|nr:angiotensin-converting enzyme isoform X2 [Cephus cinctus]